MPDKGVDSTLTFKLAGLWIWIDTREAIRSRQRWSWWSGWDKKQFVTDSAEFIFVHVFFLTSTLTDWLHQVLWIWSRARSSLVRLSQNLLRPSCAKQICPSNLSINPGNVTLLSYLTLTASIILAILKQTAKWVKKNIFINFGKLGFRSFVEICQRR